jgi:hypothetical protein
MIANFPDESLPPMSSVTKTGVYYGYARIYCPEHEKTLLCDEDGKVLPMVMSLGWNPFYKNERMTAVRPISGLVFLPDSKLTWPVGDTHSTRVPKRFLRI